MYIHKKQKERDREDVAREEKLHKGSETKKRKKKEKRKRERQNYKEKEKP